MTEILEQLKLCVSNDTSVRFGGYNILTQKLSEPVQQNSWGREMSADLAKKIINNLKLDIKDEKQDICYEASGFLGCFLANDNMMDMLTVKEEMSIMKSLLDLLELSSTKKVLTRALWSLAQSKFGLEIYGEHIDRILKIVSNVMKTEETPITIYETLLVFKSLIESIPDEMLKHTDVWFPHLFTSLFHDAVRVRGGAYLCLHSCKQVILETNNSMKSINSHLVKLIPQLKSEYCKKMVKLVDEECGYVLKIWRLLVMMLGEDLHSGTMLINGLLLVVERAFKSSKPGFRVEAFKCWHELINNFGITHSVLTHPKRLKLLISPFKANNAKCEEVAYVKMLTWWHLICQLGDEAGEHFELVIVPFLKFSLNSSGLNFGGIGERSLGLTNNSPARKYSSIQNKASEALARLLSRGQTLSTIQYTFFISDISKPIITTALFVRNQQLLFKCISDALVTLNAKEAKQNQLGLFLLESMMKHVNSVIGTDFSKKESIEVVKELCNMFTKLEEQCKTVESLSLFLYELMELMTIGKLALPSDVVNSRLYHLPSVTNMKELMNGTLSYFLIHKLCGDSLINYAHVKEGYTSIWFSVIERCNPSTNKLLFYDSVVQKLSGVSQFLGDKSPDTLARLWSLTAKQLDSYLQESLSIDQADDSIDAIYKILLFPIQNSKDGLCNVENRVYHHMLQTWKSLWNNFVVLMIMSQNIEPHYETEHIAKALLDQVQTELNVPPDSITFTLQFIVDVLNILIVNVRFGEIGKKLKKHVNSPLKTVKKSTPLYNLHSCVSLLGMLMEKSMRIILPARHQIVQKICITTTKICNDILGEKISWAFLDSLLDNLNQMLEINPSAKFTGDVEQEFLFMWEAICNLMETTFNKKLGNDQLIRISSLITTSLYSSHHGLKQRTRKMWKKIYSDRDSKFKGLNIPPKLHQALKDAQLPPASICDTPEKGNETISTSPKENIPTHISGSYLNRDKDKNQKIVFTPNSKSKHTAFSPILPDRLSLKERLSVGATPNSRTRDAMRELDKIPMEEFVTISSPKPKKRILTPHQAEKMRQRRPDIPAMYNDLSQSMSQLPPQCATQESFDDSISQIFTDSKKPEGTVKSNNADLSFEGKISSLMSNVNDEKPLLSNSNKNAAPTKDIKNKKRKFNSLTVMQNEDQNHENVLGKPISDSIIALSDTDDESFASPLPPVLVTPQHQRKSKTPSKKSLIDVRNSLRGKKQKSPRDKSILSEVSIDKEKIDTLEDCSLNTPKGKKGMKNIKKRKEISPLFDKELSPCVSDASNLSPLSKRMKAPSSNSESEDEIPSSQILDCDSCDFSPSSANGRPKRNKRKSIFQDGSKFVTPTKRSRNSDKNAVNGEDKSEINDGSISASSVKGRSKKSPKIVESSSSDTSEAENRVLRKKTSKTADEEKFPDDLSSKLLSNEISSYPPKSKSKAAISKSPSNDSRDLVEKSNDINLQSENKQNHEHSVQKKISDFFIEEGYNVEPEKSLNNQVDDDKLTLLEKSIDLPLVTQNCTRKIDSNCIEDPSPSNKEPEAIIIHSFNKKKESDNLPKTPSRLSQRLSKVKDIESPRYSRRISVRKISNSDSGREDSTIEKIISIKENSEILSEKILVSSAEILNNNLSKDELNKENLHCNEILSPDLIANEENLTTPSTPKILPSKVLSPMAGSKNIIDESRLPDKVQSPVKLLFNDSQKEGSPLNAIILKSMNSTTENNEVSMASTTKVILLSPKKLFGNNIAVSKGKTSERVDNESEGSEMGEISLTKTISVPPTQCKDDLAPNNLDTPTPPKSPNKINNQTSSEEFSSNLSKHFSKIGSPSYISPHKTMSPINPASGRTLTFLRKSSLANSSPSKKTPILLLSSSVNSPQKLSFTKAANEFSSPSKSNDLISNQNTSNINVSPSKIDKIIDSDEIIDSDKPLEEPLLVDMDDFLTDKLPSSEKILQEERSVKESELPQVENNSLTNESEVTQNEKDETADEETDETNSKLANSLGTPERKKLKKGKKVQMRSSRAALMLACAKRTMRSRGNDDTPPESPSNEMSKLQLSISDTPPNRSKKNDELSCENQPWKCHEPSPKASPSNGILKKRNIEDEVSEMLVGESTDSPESSPSVLKNRRVSFADPPVSSSVLIPPSPKTLKGIRAQKRLDMTSLTKPNEEKEGQYLSKSPDEDEEPDNGSVSTSETCLSTVSSPDKVTAKDKIESTDSPKVSNVLRIQSPNSKIVQLEYGPGTLEEDKISIEIEDECSNIPILAKDVMLNEKTFKSLEDELPRSTPSDEKVSDSKDSPASVSLSNMSIEEKKDFFIQLSDSLPYNDVIDLFHNYLKSKAL